jgi:hypothetical protein
MTLTSNQRAYLTARLGAGRLGAIRLGFIPKATQGTSPGVGGPFYVWRTVALPTTVWTAVKR